MSVLDRLSREALDCRSMGHAWKHTDDAGIRQRAGEVVSFRRLERCVRCGAQRARTVDLDRGEITSRSISYPENYLLPSGAPRVYRAEVLAHDFERYQK